MGWILELNNLKLIEKMNVKIIISDKYSTLCLLCIDFYVKVNTEYWGTHTNLEGKYLDLLKWTLMFFILRKVNWWKIKLLNNFNNI
jgi:hypothetical protein